jgi:hypothetical protein
MMEEEGREVAVRLVMIAETRPFQNFVSYHQGWFNVDYRIRETRIWYRISLGSIHPAMAIPEPVQYTVYLQARLNATCVRLIQWIFQRTRVCVSLTSWLPPNQRVGSIQWQPRDITRLSTKDVILRNSQRPLLLLVFQLSWSSLEA